ncbi:hypothetical protein EDD86DRAFT_202551 [Gorgonomyces haynaldii]|nr:hypothetical protein EDD86DRAFT_202551 [Gorgonomyces haynaldii]
MKVLTFLPLKELEKVAEVEMIKDPEQLIPMIQHKSIVVCQNIDWMSKVKMRLARKWVHQGYCNFTIFYIGSGSQKLIILPNLGFDLYGCSQESLVTDIVTTTTKPLMLNGPVYCLGIDDKLTQDTWQPTEPRSSMVLQHTWKIFNPQGLEKRYYTNGKVILATIVAFGGWCVQTFSMEKSNTNSMQKTKRPLYDSYLKPVALADAQMVWEQQTLGWWLSQRAIKEEKRRQPSLQRPSESIPPPAKRVKS